MVTSRSGDGRGLAWCDGNGGQTQFPLLLHTWSDFSIQCTLYDWMIEIKINNLIEAAK